MGSVRGQGKALKLAAGSSRGQALEDPAVSGARLLFELFDRDVRLGQ
jgi:hypothetical protein